MSFGECTICQQNAIINLNFPPCLINPYHVLVIMIIKTYSPSPEYLVFSSQFIVTHSKFVVTLSFS